MPTRAAERTVAAGLVLFTAAAVANLLPALWFAHLPVTDGPSHVYNAALFTRYFFGHGDVLQRIVEGNRSLPPNVMAHGLLSILMTKFEPIVAERLVIVSYALLLPLALRHVLRSVSERTHGIEFLALGLVFNSHLHWGFYNFLLGLVTYCFALGWWLRTRHRDLALMPVAVMTVAITALYFCHPVPLIEFWISVCVIWLGESFLRRTWALNGLRQAATASGPALALSVHYLVTRVPNQAESFGWPKFRYAASLLFKLSPLATYTTAERWSAIALSAAVAGAIIWAWISRLAFRSRIELLLAAAVTGLIVFGSPTEGAGGTLITPRLVYFPLLLTLMWLTSLDWPPLFARAAVTLGVVLALTSAASRWPIYERYDARMREFLAAARTLDRGAVAYFHTAGPGTTLLLDHTGTPYLSAAVWGYVAADRKQVLLSDYEAHTGTFPFKFRTGFDPTLYELNANCAVPAGLVDDAAYRQNTGIEIDLILIWIDRDYVDRKQCLRGAVREPQAEIESSQGSLLKFRSFGE